MQSTRHSRSFVVADSAEMFARPTQPDKGRRAFVEGDIHQAHLAQTRRCAECCDVAQADAMTDAKDLQFCGRKMQPREVGHGCTTKQHLAKTRWRSQGADVAQLLAAAPKLSRSVLRTSSFFKQVWRASSES